MKKIFVVFAAVLIIGACKQKEGGLGSGTVNIQGSIAGADSGYLEMLLPSREDRKVDSIKIEKGKFKHKLSVKEPELVIMRIAGNFMQGNDLIFWADAGDVKIKAYADSMWSSEVSAGITQKTFKEAENRIKPVMEKEQLLMPAYMQAQQSQNMEEMQKIEMQVMGIREEAQQAAVAFARENTNSVLSAYIGLVYMQGKDAELKSLYDSLSPAVQKSFYGLKIGEAVSAAASMAIGAAAPEFMMNDVNGNPVSLSAFKGKYLLIDFWASWCKPCREENPHVVKAFQNYKDKNFTILGVSLDKEKAAWVQAIADDQLSWTHVSDLKFWDNAAARLYQVQSIPANFLLDAEGRIIAKNLRGEELQSKLATLIK
jgi:peroxiredoxin